MIGNLVDLSLCLHALAAIPISDCNVTDGIIQITASGPGALNYSIDNGTTWQASDLFIGLSAGTYNILARNVDGTCQETYGSNPVTITAPSPPTVSGISSTNPSDCGLVDGIIMITATATGTGALEYSKNGGVNWQASNVFNNLGTGNYTIVVRNAGGTCEVVYSNNPAVLTAPNAGMVTNVTANDPSTCGGSDGMIIIGAQGGNAPLRYSIVPFPDFSPLFHWP